MPRSYRELEKDLEVFPTTEEEVAAFEKELESEGKSLSSLEELSESLRDPEKVFRSFGLDD